MHQSGTVLGGRYRVQEPIGRGGMQQVYCGVDEVLNREVALKVPLIDSSARRFHETALLSSKVRSHCVAATLDYYSDDSGQFLVEELLESSTLKELMDSVGLCDPYLAAFLIQRMSAGLLAAHDEGILHRDLKPTNVLVGVYEQPFAVKITDFGIARMAETEFAEAFESYATTSKSSTAMGAIPYMAPEYFEGKGVTLKADVWSLGAMLFHILSGVLPFGSGLPAMKRISLGKVDFGAIRKSGGHQYGVLVSELVTLMEGCLTVDVDRRFSALELYQASEKLCYHFSQRSEGRIGQYPFKNPSDGLITASDGETVYFHRESCHGFEPTRGEEVWFDASPGVPFRRAYPVCKWQRRSKN